MYCAISIFPNQTLKKYMHMHMQNWIRSPTKADNTFTVINWWKGFDFFPSLFISYFIHPFTERIEGVDSFFFFILRFIELLFIIGKGGTFLIPLTKRKWLLDTCRTIIRLLIQHYTQVTQKIGYTLMIIQWIIIPIWWILKKHWRISKIIPSPPHLL